VGKRRYTQEEMIGHKKKKKRKGLGVSGSGPQKTFFLHDQHKKTVGKRREPEYYSRAHLSLRGLPKANPKNLKRWCIGKMHGRCGIERTFFWKKRVWIEEGGPTMQCCKKGGCSCLEGRKERRGRESRKPHGAMSSKRKNVLICRDVDKKPIDRPHRL